MLFQSWIKTNRLSAVVHLLYAIGALKKYPLFQIRLVRRMSFYNIDHINQSCSKFYKSCTIWLIDVNGCNMWYYRKDWKRKIDDLVIYKKSARYLSIYFAILSLQNFASIMFWPALVNSLKKCQKYLRNPEHYFTVLLWRIRAGYYWSAMLCCLW